MAIDVSLTPQLEELRHAIREGIDSPGLPADEVFAELRAEFEALAGTFHAEAASKAQKPIISDVVQYVVNY